ncbi:MAG TPA: TlpA disulfide reductase family protein, partial [Sphingobacteriaceae bacterium]
KLIEDFTNAEKRRNTVESDIKENYIVNHPGSLLSAYLLSQSETDISKKPALYNDLYENLAEEIKKSKYAIKARSLIQSALKRNTKFHLPDIEGKMPDGSSFNPKMIKGKITLVMFWASWNQLSTNDLASLKSTYQKLKPRGFEILAIALDKSPEKWKKYIKDNQLNWLHVSDFKGAASENITSFNNNKIPYYFLVGPDLQVTDQDFPVSSVEIYFNDLKSKSRAK